MISLQNLTYFMKICETGSMSKAAEQLYISQPALSLAMKNLETELKTELMIRTNRGIEITENGRRLYQHGKMILRQLSFIDNFSEFRGETQMSVSAFPFLVWPGVFTRLRALPEFEHIQISFKESRIMQILQDVYELSSEVGVIQYSDRQAPYLMRRIDKLGLSLEKLCTRQWSIIVGEHSPLYCRGSVTLQDLLPYRLLRLKDDDMSLLTGITQVNKTQTMEDYVCDYVDSGIATVELLRNTSAYMFICEQKHFVNDNLNFHIIPVEGDIRITVGYVYKNGIHISPASQTFLRMFEEEI